MIVLNMRQLYMCKIILKQGKEHAFAKRAILATFYLPYLFIASRKIKEIII